MTPSGLPTLETYSAVDTPDLGSTSRPYSPMPVAEDVQAYFTSVVQDGASEYNTEYEDLGEGDHDGSSVGGGDVGIEIDEELARLT